ncbi:peptidoglycan DD-metalloendopeptidase family protein, partial [Erythrobacter alti]|uniref:peptidoglycan DD-metalloendopeptidase family protein n=1 Tax=Erythrobacter alti TaxID=1896145 RepID=UPI0030F3DC70
MPIASRFRHPLGDGSITASRDGDGYYVAQGFDEPNGELGGTYHLGADWNGEGGGDTDLGDPVFAIGNGTVIAIVGDQGGSTTGFGNYIILRHDLPEPEVINGITVTHVHSLYAHLDSVAGLSVGQDVAIGQQIGSLGSSGASSLAHLHFEITLNDTLPTADDGYNPAGAPATWVDPVAFVDARLVGVGASSETLSDLADFASLSDLAYGSSDLLASGNLPDGWQYVPPGELGMTYQGLTEAGAQRFSFLGHEVLVDTTGVLRNDIGGVQAGVPGENGMFVARNGETGQIALVFRGTDPSLLAAPADFIQSYPGIVTDNLDSALSQFDAVFAALTSYLADLSGSYEVVATGHSLGGALAAEALNYSSNVSLGYGFGAPGMTVDGAGQFTIIRHQNDLVGEMFDSRIGSNDLLLWDNRNGERLNLASHSLGQYNSELSRLAQSDIFAAYPADQIFSIFIANEWNGYHGVMPSDPAPFYNVFGGLPGDFIDARGTSGKVMIDGYGGDDTIHGSTFADFLAGNAGRDTIYGEGGDDTIYGGGQNDDLRGQGGNDTIYGGRDADTIYGGIGQDRLFGEHGFDTLRGESENDFLYGGDGGDTLYGDGGNDVLNGEADADTMFGGPGADLFVFDGSSIQLGLFQYEIIKDFNQGNTGSYDSGEGDVIDLTAIFTEFGGLGQAATTLWKTDSASGKTYISVDPDGNGAMGWRRIIELEGLPSNAQLNVLVDDGVGGGGEVTTGLTVSSPGSFTITPSSRYVGEHNGSITFVVSRPETASSETVYISTTINRGSLNNSDYEFWLNVPVTFAAGESARDVTINILDDANEEYPETFGLIVQSNPDQPASEYLASASFTIIDDDFSGPSGTPTDGNDVFTFEGVFSSIDAGLGFDSLAANFGQAHYNGHSIQWMEIRSSGELRFGYNGTFRSIYLSNFESYNITGTDGGDFFYGLDGGNTFHGLEGNDRIFGGIAADLLDGGAGNDTFYQVGFGDVVEGGSGNDLVNFDFSGHTENLTINLATGEATGGALTGIEQVAGILGSGDDSIAVFGNLFGIDGGAGTDTITLDYSDASTADGTQITHVHIQESGRLIYYYAGGWVDSRYFNSFESFNVTATNGNDNITGGDAGNRLYGLDGNDYLKGGSGVDLLDGGAGNDTFYQVGFGDVVEGGSG